MSKECPKCGYIRKEEEFAPEWQCPKCQIVYAKYRQESESYPDYPQGEHMGGSTEDVQSGRGISSVVKLLLTLSVLIAGGYFIYSTFSDYGYRTADEVVVFTSSDCAPCKDLFKLLDYYELEYTIYDVDESEENMELFKEEGRGSLPLMLVGRHKVEGYDERRIGIALDGVMEDFVDEEGNVIIIMYSTTT
jgi:glutaredoxin